jgi:hypothetical protein
VGGTVGMVVVGGSVGMVLGGSAGLVLGGSVPVGGAASANISPICVVPKVNLKPQDLQGGTEAYMFFKFLRLFVYIIIIIL